MKNTKYLLTYIVFILFFILNKSSLANEKIIFTFENEEYWTITCDLFDKKYLNGSEFENKFIFKALSKKYTPGLGYKEKTWENSFKSIYKIESNGKDITNEGIRLCPDKASDHQITIQTDPIYYFITDPCSSGQKINDQYILDLLQQNLDENKLKFLYKQKEDNKKFDPVANKKFLKEDIYEYNKRANGISCSKDEKTHFTVKNINSYIDNDLITNTATTPPQTITSNEEQIKICSEFSYEELKIQIDANNRIDCKEELIKRDEANKLEEDKLNEYNKNIETLIEFENFYKKNDILNLISSASLNSIKKDISDFKRNLEDYNNIEEIDNAYKPVYAKVNIINKVLINFDLFFKICDENSSFDFTSYQNYQYKCDEIYTFDDFEKIKNSVEQRKEKGTFQEINNLVSKLESSQEERKNLIQTANDLVKEMNSKKIEIDNSINFLNGELDDLIEEIRQIIDILRDQNRDFDPTEVFNDQSNQENLFQESLNNLKTKLENISSKISKFNGDGKKDLENKLDDPETKISELDTMLSNYIVEFNNYLQNDKQREKWKKEDKKRIAEEKKREQEEADRIAEEKKRAREAAEVAQEEEKIKETIININKLDKDINRSLKNLETNIEDEISNLDSYIFNFKATNDDVIDFNAINSKIQKSEKLINKYLQEYGDAISSLPSDFDNEKFDFDSIDDLKFNKIYFKRELEGLLEVMSNKLNLKINEAKALIDSREDQLVQIVSETNEELLLKEQELENKEAEKQKLEEEKRIAEEKNKQKEQLIDEKTGEIQSKEQTIQKLQDDIKILKSNLVIEKENVSNRNLMIYLLIGLSLILAGLIIYFIIRKKPSSTSTDEAYDSKINELEQRLEREIQQSRAQANNQTTTPIKSEVPKEIKKEPTQEEIKNEQLRKLYEDYNAAMKIPNLIETFQSNYNAIGLERESKIATGRKVRLRRVNTSFDRAIFWVVEHDRKLLVFGGRMLKVQAPSLLADDGTMARDLLQGIFALQTGPDLKTHKCAIVHKNNQIYEVMMEGTLQLPKID